MSLKVHFLEIHLDFFPVNLSKVSDEHRELLLQYIPTIARRYHGKWSRSMLADYCWTLRGGVPQAHYSGNSSTVTFW